MRFWVWPRLAVVVCQGGKLDEEVHLDRCAVDGIPIFRRGSGGGTVLLGPGCLLYSLILPMDAHPALGDLNASYRFIMARMALAFAEDLPGASNSESSDLVWRDRKISGNAQQRKRAHLLHHGTVLDHFDLSLIGRSIKHPPRMPDYRRARPHEDFVVNVNLGAQRIMEILSSAWNVAGLRSDWPEKDVARLVAEKYGSDEWNSRR